MKKSKNSAEAFCVGLLAVSIAAVFQLIAIEKLDWLLRTALWLFASSIPMLSVLILILREDDSNIPEKIQSLVIFLGGVSVVQPVLALTIMFFHHSRIAGGIFIISCCICIWIFSAFLTHLDNSKLGTMRSCSRVIQNSRTRRSR